MFVIPKPKGPMGKSQKEIFINNLQTYADNHVGDGQQGAVALENLFLHPRSIFYEDIESVIGAFKRDMDEAGYDVNVSGGYLCWRVRSTEEDSNG